MLGKDMYLRPFMHSTLRNWEFGVILFQCAYGSLLLIVTSSNQGSSSCMVTELRGKGGGIECCGVIMRWDILEATIMSTVPHDLHLVMLVCMATASIESFETSPQDAALKQSYSEHP